METATSRATKLHQDAIIINCLAAARDVRALAQPMLAGGVTAVNWTVAAPGLDFAVNDLVGVIKRIAQIRHTVAHGGSRALIVESVDDLRTCKQQGLAGLILGFQDTLPIEDQLEMAGLYYRLGVRIVQLTYQRRNLVGDGCGEPLDAGLSTFGRQLVAELNRLGILIDLSHVGPRTTDEAIEASAVPCAFTHANAHARFPHIRNKSDEAIKRLAARGGVIGVDAISRFIRESGHRDGTTIEDLLDHIAYIADLVGPDHVGIGLDITEGMTVEDVGRRAAWVAAQLPEVSGAGNLDYETYYPRGLRSMAGVPSITEALVRRGFDDDDVLNILGGNFLRLFETVWTPHPPLERSEKEKEKTH
jgi:membrane dipeptidase